MKRSLLIICIAFILCGAVLFGYTSGLFNGLITNNTDNNQAGIPGIEEIIPDDDEGKDNDDSNDTVIPEDPEETIIEGSATGDVTDVLNEKNALASGVELVSDNGLISATLPEGTLIAEGVAELTFSVKELEVSAADITLADNESSLSLDVHIEGLSADNESVIKVYVQKLLPIGLNMGNYSLYHVENGETVLMTLLGNEEPVHNSFEYDPVTGDTVMYLKSFSEIALVSNSENAWTGKYDFNWFSPEVDSYVIANADQLAAFGAIVGGMSNPIDGSFAYTTTLTDENGEQYEYHAYNFYGKTIKLVANINLGDDEANNNPNIIFYPIGYYNSEYTYAKDPNAATGVTSGFRTFEGIFDGNGNTIKNFYQNTWEMKGDHDWYDAKLQYYRDGMGLFGKVYGGTVKNLTVANFSSDGEIATTGVIAAYADCGAVFENIAILNCNPRVYNIGNGGIVGCAGWYNKTESTVENPIAPVTFRNITVDQTNKISALWGSWDVSCGGILGQYYPTSGQSSANYPANTGIYFENCHVAAQIDVNNDVCANYQYYWYRYSGMFIGNVRASTKDANGYTIADTTGITAVDCTYTLGDWNEYWYCELVANSLASYTHDHQFSRLTKIKDVSEIQDEQGNWNKEGNFVIPNADNTAATCYHIFKNSEGNLYQHFHNVADESNPNIYETFDLNSDGELNDLKEDRTCYFMPFSQLFNGNGYGIKAHYEFAGITEKPDGPVKSEQKFESLDVTAAYRPGQTVTLSQLVNSIVDDSKLSKISIFAAVSPATENDKASAIYSLDLSNWRNSTITFGAKCEGSAKIVITDYFYCTETVITVRFQKPIDMSIGDRTYNIENDKWLFNTQTEDGTDATNNANSCYYDLLIYDSDFTGSVANENGVAIVLDKYGIVRGIFDPNNLAYWTSTGKGATHFTSANYASFAFSHLKDGELLLVFPYNENDNASYEFAFGLIGNIASTGASATDSYIDKTLVMTGITCEGGCIFCGRCTDLTCGDYDCHIKCAGCRGIKIGNSVSDVGSNVVLENVPLPDINANTFLIYTDVYKAHKLLVANFDISQVLVDEDGVAIIIDTEGKAEKIYNSGEYFVDAWNYLTEGKYMIVAPSAATTAKEFLTANYVVGAEVIYSVTSRALDIDAKDEFKYEAEDLNTDNLIPPSGRLPEIQEAEGTTSGGLSLGYCQSGWTTITIDAHANLSLVIKARLAYNTSGNASDYMSITVDGLELTTTGKILGKDPNGTNDYWYWSDCQYGQIIDLEEGIHVIKITVKQNVNIDCFKFDVVTYGSYHKLCELCGKCDTEGCKYCGENTCEFLDKSNVIQFVPNAQNPSTPEGPDGIKPGEEGAYIQDNNINTSLDKLPDGTHVALIELPNGTAANSGLSFLSNTYYADIGALGYNSNIPIIKGQPKTVRLHFTNNGASDLKIKYSVIFYYRDDGAVTVTVPAGESVSVLMDLNHYLQNSDTEAEIVGANHQIVFPEGAPVDSSLTIWGEFITDDLSGISISTSATKTEFMPGETFTAEGLILKLTSAVKAGDGGNLYHRVFVASNYTTSLDGYVFTDTEAGKTKTVTVTFGGVTTTYTVTVHAHSIEYVEETPADPCKTDGIAAHYKCSGANCNAYFEDAAGTIKIAAPKKISCHTVPTEVILPGEEVICTACGNSFVAEDPANWVFLNITTATREVGTNIKNLKLEQSVVNGKPGTKITIGAGTIGSETEDSAFHLIMTNNENDPGRQAFIPNLNNSAADGVERKVILYFENYSNEDITLKFANDKFSAASCTVTIPANGNVTVKFSDTHKESGTNWYYYYVLSDTTQDVSFGVYGYFAMINGETNDISINQSDSVIKTTYKVGDAFTSDGIIIDTYTSNRTIYVQTGYATDFDGKVFTANDIGRHRVTVFFAGKTTTYEITVTE